MQQGEALIAQWQQSLVKAVPAELGKRLDELWAYYFPRAYFQGCIQALLDGLNALEQKWGSEGGLQKEQAVFLARLRLACGHSLRHLGKVSQARQMLEQSLAVFEQTQEKKLLAETLLDLAECSPQEALLEKARQGVQSCLKELSDNKQTLSFISLLLKFGYRERVLGLYTESQAHLQEALQLLEIHPDPSSEAFCRASLGETLYLLGQLPPAMRLFQEAGSLYGHLKDPVGAAWTKTNTGAVAIRLGLWKEAKQALEEGYKGYSKKGVDIGAAWCLEEQGNLASARGFYAEGRRFYQQALQIYESKGHFPASATVLRYLGELERQEGKLNQAAQHFRRALQASRLSGNHLGEVKTLASLARLAHQRQQIQQSLELASFLLKNRYADYQTREQATEIHRLAASLSLPEQVESAERLAASKTLEQIVGDWLKEAA